jgi:F0F1-type ATP synthase assembly protein I
MTEKRKITEKFLLASFILLIAVAVPFLLLGSRISIEEIFPEFFAGSLSTWIVACAFFSLLSWSYKKSTRIFHFSLFGGMALKIIVLLAVIAAAIAIFRVNYLWFIVTIMVYYLAFQVLEITFFAKYFR